MNLMLKPSDCPVCGSGFKPARGSVCKMHIFAYEMFEILREIKDSTNEQFRSKGRWEPLSNDQIGMIHDIFERVQNY